MVKMRYPVVAKCFGSNPWSGSTFPHAFNVAHIRQELRKS